MSDNTNTTVTFISPLPEAARAGMQAVLQASDFALDWDAQPVAVDQLSPGVVSLFGRNCRSDEVTEMLELAKAHNFSVVIHFEDRDDLEGQSTSEVSVFDVTSGREAFFMAENISREPLITVEQHFTLSRDDFRKRFLLPKDILDAQGDEAPAWCKMLQSA